VHYKVVGVIVGHAHRGRTRFLSATPARAATPADPVENSAKAERAPRVKKERKLMQIGTFARLLGRGSATTRLAAGFLLATCSFALMRDAQRQGC